MKKSEEKYSFVIDTNIKKKIDYLIAELKFDHINSSQVFCIRSTGSKTRAYARIWGLSRVFQVACNIKPSYVIEVISKYFDKLDSEKQIEVLVHELMHIPKTFSGALLSHRGRYHRINEREVLRLINQFKLLQK